jgi:release factor glutamine methyltransferase
VIKRTIKYFVGHIYKPVLEKYLRKTRRYRYKGIKLTIPPEVFHPAFFFTSKLLFNYINKLNLKGKNFLEIGAGSGFISILAAKKRAEVTATDINPVAIEYLGKNAKANAVNLNIILSDLFEKIPVQTFDVIAVNPPFYKKDPVSFIDYAWYCGKNGEYFQRLFCDLAKYFHRDSKILMLLSDICDLAMIEQLAARNNFFFIEVQRSRILWETFFIFEIRFREKLTSRHA